ncbi:MAG TPA: hypothetical protein VNW48_01785 [Xanthobacteraceae bacterium]|nr:hypothetical protein [Xanthobacteraceae bacterium]
MPEPFARGLGKQNVPRRHPSGASLAQSGGDRLARFAEADEADCRLHLSHRHRLFNITTRR